jgi:MFS family permease
VTATSSDSTEATATAPARSGLVLITLILVAAVANLNLAAANVALPEIGKAFDASQTALKLVAVGYSLGLAASVLYLGALGDRYGRKLMLVLGTSLAIPAALAAVALLMAIAFVPSHVNEATDPVDNLGGILSVLLVASLVLAINFAAVPNKGALALGLERLLWPRRSSS